VRAIALGVPPYHRRERYGEDVMLGAWIKYAGWSGKHVSVRSRADWTTVFSAEQQQQRNAAMSKPNTFVALGDYRFPDTAELVMYPMARRADAIVVHVWSKHVELLYALWDIYLPLEHLQQHKLSSRDDDDVDNGISISTRTMAKVRTHIDAANWQPFIDYALPNVIGTGNFWHAKQRRLDVQHMSARRVCADALQQYSELTLALGEYYTYWSRKNDRLLRRPTPGQFCRSKGKEERRHGGEDEDASDPPALSDEQLVFFHPPSGSATKRIKNTMLSAV
jgi:hypothetical protein